jgi:CRP/FNR family cyclic AMP-dependent transcriptional regulator
LVQAQWLALKAPGSPGADCGVRDGGQSLTVASPGCRRIDVIRFASELLLPEITFSYYVSETGCSRWHLRPEARRDLLQGVTIFNSLSDAAIARIEAWCKWREIAAGSTIVSYLDLSSDVHFLIAGKARAIIYAADGHTVLFKDIHPGEEFGEIAALDRGPRSSSVEALEACTIVSLSADSFSQVLLDEPGVAIIVLRRLTAQIRRLSERVHEFSTLGVQSRIRAELLRLAALSRMSGNEAILSPAPSLSELASRVSTHREAVSRELSRLGAMNIAFRERSVLRIADVARLEQLVREAKGE